MVTLKGCSVEFGEFEVNVLADWYTKGKLMVELTEKNLHLMVCTPLPTDEEWEPKIDDERISWHTHRHCMYARYTKNVNGPQKRKFKSIAVCTGGTHEEIQQEVDKKAKKLAKKIDNTDSSSSSDASEA